MQDRDYGQMVYLSENGYGFLRTGSRRSRSFRTHFRIKAGYSDRRSCRLCDWRGPTWPAEAQEAKPLLEELRSLIELARGKK